MERISNKIFAVLLLLTFSFQFYGCDSILTNKNKNSNLANNSKEIVSTDNIAKMKINIKLVDSTTISIDLNEPLNENLLSKLNIDELTLMKYAYYAKYNYQFSDPSYVKYFSQYSWYQPINTNIDNKLTLIDKQNIKLLEKYEEMLTSTSQPTPEAKATIRINPPSNKVTSLSHEIYLDFGYGTIITIDLDRKINEDLLWELTAEELAYIRNGYFAKYGYIFSTSAYSNYFNQYPWYSPKSRNVESSLTELDKINIALIQQYEADLAALNSSDYNVNYKYIWLNLSEGFISVDLDEKLFEDLLYQLNSDSLAILRNAYYAKHGYIFSKQKYTNYFNQYEWYQPKSKNVESKLTSTDKENISLIQKYE